MNSFAEPLPSDTVPFGNAVIGSPNTHDLGASGLAAVLEIALLILPRSVLVTAATVWLPDEVGLLRRYGLALFILAVGLLAGALVHPLLPDRIFVTLFPAIAIASLLTGFGPAVLVSVVGGIAAVYFWMPLRQEWPELGPAVANVLVFVGMGSLISAFGHLVRLLVRELRQAELSAELRADEMHHRIKNLFNVIVAVGRSTLPKENEEVQAFWETLESRLRGLSNAQQLIVRPELQAELEPLIRRVLDGQELDRFSFQGPTCHVVTSTQLVLALHELATNALKYGALSVPSGRVAISWTAEPTNITIRWAEYDGPPIGSPGPEGFGSKVLRWLNATRTFHPGGVCVMLTVPRAQGAEVDVTPQAA